MRTAIKALVLTTVLGWAIGGCSGCGSDGDHQEHPDAATDNTFDQCGGDAASFVRQSFLALDGRRPLSQAEVDVYVELYKAAETLGEQPKDVVARAIMNRPEFADHWTEIVMDALHVQRLDIQTEADCWDTELRSTVVPDLAAAVRDQPATQPGSGAFTMLDLAKSALALDDLSPIYRAQLFSLNAHPIPAANVDDVQAELARREDFGSTFDAGYLHRDVVCLGCHNSETSVTDSDDPALDRHWPVPGLPEKAVFGISTGVSSEVAHAVFRTHNFVDNGNTMPWGWSSRCGKFASPTTVANDIAGVTAKLASITGQRSTVFDLESSLARGFTALRGTALPGDAAIADPDTALAWLVTLKMTEDVWRQATGTSLTIANYFPRNKAASDQLYALATTFAKSGYSLKTLLAAIVASDYFNRQAPELGCGASPYTYPAVFDPWVISDADEAKRKNGPGDAVQPLDPRTLVGAAAAALEWPAPPAASLFPDYGEGCDNSTCNGMQQACNQFGACCASYAAACQMNGVVPSVEVPFQRAVGMFLRNSERGFRGLDFQARLAWENRYGACAKPRWVTEDFVDRLLAASAADPTATAGDVVSALKDRLIGEPAIADGAEHDVLTSVVGPLEGPATAVTPTALRQVCGALVHTPQFLLAGIAGKGGERPKLTPASAGFDAVCADLAARGIGVPGHLLTCTPTSVTLVLGRMVEPHVPAPTVRPEPPLRRRMAPAREMAPLHRM